MVAMATMDTPRRTRVRRYSCLRDTSLRGFITLVNTHDGPQKTSSSSSTPSYTETLFWILTWLPILPPAATNTFCPMVQSLPIEAPAITWEKCQIRVPLPIEQPGSTQALGWINTSL